MKTCSKCGETKALEEFHKRAASKDGLQPLCKLCACKKSRANAADNQDHVRANKAAYYQKNAGRLKAYAACKYRENPNPTKERSKAWAKTERGRAWFNKRAKTSSKAMVAELTDKYVKRVIGTQQVTPDLINLKREQLRLHRLAKQLKQAATEAMEKDKS